MDNTYEKILHSKELFLDYLSVISDIVRNSPYFWESLRMSIIKHLDMEINFELFGGYIHSSILFENDWNNYYIFLYDKPNLINDVKNSISKHDVNFHINTEQYSIYTRLDEENDMNNFKLLVNTPKIFQEFGINLYIEDFQNDFGKLYTIKFIFNTDYYNIYKVQPLESNKNDIYDNLYSAYKNKIIPFDYKIYGMSKSYGVHRLILYTNGGDYFKNYMTGKFKESQYDYIKFPEFKDKTIEIFLDYLYSAEFPTDKDFDIIELYEFAEFVQNNNLIIDSLNVLNFNSTKKDYDTLYNLYERYGNKYLASII